MQHYVALSLVQSKHSCCSSARWRRIANSFQREKRMENITLMQSVDAQ